MSLAAVYLGNLTHEISQPNFYLKGANNGSHEGSCGNNPLLPLELFLDPAGVFPTMKFLEKLFSSLCSLATDVARTIRPREE